MSIQVGGRRLSPNAGPVAVLRGDDYATALVALRSCGSRGSPRHRPLRRALLLASVAIASAGLAGCSGQGSNLTVTVTGKDSSAAQNISCTPNGLSVHVTGNFTNQSGHRRIALVSAKIKNSEGDIVGFHGQSFVLAYGQAKSVDFTVESRQTADSCIFSWKYIPVPSNE
jgi:hypothetical protein